MVWKVPYRWWRSCSQIALLGKKLRCWFWSLTSVRCKHKATIVLLLLKVQMLLSFFENIVNQVMTSTNYLPWMQTSLFITLIRSPSILQQTQILCVKSANSILLVRHVGNIRSFIGTMYFCINKYQRWYYLYVRTSSVANLQPTRSSNSLHTWFAACTFIFMLWTYGIWINATASYRLAIRVNGPVQLSLDGQYMIFIIRKVQLYHKLRLK
jgi:hypothetical protein